VALPQLGIVTANILVVRARPAPHYERIGQFARGDKVIIVGANADWYEVRVPADTRAWIAAQYLNEAGTVSADLVRLHSGPGLVFTTFCMAKQGDKLDVLGPPVDGWQQVRAPADASAWISRIYVRTLDPEPVAAPAVTPPPEPKAEAPAAAPVAVVPPAEAKTEPPPAPEVAPAPAAVAPAAEAKTEPPAAAPVAVAPAAEAKTEPPPAPEVAPAPAAVAPAAEAKTEPPPAPEVAPAPVAVAPAAEAKTEPPPAPEVAPAPAAVAPAAEAKTEPPAAAPLAPLAPTPAAPQAATSAAPAPAAAAPTATPATAAAPGAEAGPVSAAPAPEAPIIMREGVLLSLKSQASELASHVLCRRVDTTAYPVCYLKSARLDLTEWENREVRVYGSELRLPGWSLAVLHVHSIQVNLKQ
jgi:hypothetical protein